MASGGKRKTTMAKLAREHKLRERRADKQARKDARQQAALDEKNAPQERLSAMPPEAGAADAALDSQDPHSDEAVRALADIEVAPGDPLTREVALIRLRETPDEELALFEDRLRGDALDAGASEQEMRQAQRDHPGHGA